MRYYLGRWVWDAIEQAWLPPAGAIGTLDLRPLSEQGTPGGPASDSSIFVTPDSVTLGQPWTQIASDPDETLNANRIRALREAMGSSNAVAQTRFANVVYELLTEHADPDGIRCNRPLMPTAKRKLGIWLGGRRIMDRPFDLSGPEWPLIQASLQRQYRQARIETLAGRVRDKRGDVVTDFHQQRLQVWLEKYRLQPSQFVLFVPDDLPKTEGPRPHSTVITEDWTCADSTDLSCDLTWTDTRETWSLTANEAWTTGTTGGTQVHLARAEHDLSSDDHYAQVSDCGTTGDGLTFLGGGVCRHHGSDITCYFGGFRNGNTSAVSHLIRKFVANTLTGLATADHGLDTRSHIPSRLDVSGSDLELFESGVSKLTTTDTSITGNTRAGINARPQSAHANEIDNFEAGDLAAGVSIPVIHHHRQRNF